MSDTVPQALTDSQIEEYGEEHKHEIAFGGHLHIRNFVRAVRAINALASQPAAEPPAHTDHLSQHWDRTCPGCIAEEALSVENKPVAWVTTCPYCSREIHIAKTGANPLIDPVHKAFELAYPYD